MRALYSDHTLGRSVKTRLRNCIGLALRDRYKSLADDGKVKELEKLLSEEKDLLESTDQVSIITTSSLIAGRILIYWY